MHLAADVYETYFVEIAPHTKLYPLSKRSRHYQRAQFLDSEGLNRQNAKQTRVRSPPNPADASAKGGPSADRTDSRAGGASTPTQMTYHVLFIQHTETAQTYTVQMELTESRVWVRPPAGTTDDADRRADHREPGVGAVFQGAAAVEPAQEGRDAGPDVPVVPVGPDAPDALRGLYETAGQGPMPLTPAAIEAVACH